MALNLEPLNYLAETSEDYIMEKAFDPEATERRCYQTWEQQNCFSPSGQGEGYCIAIPPPNVTGSLHMGHAFQDTIMDTLIRYHRMDGRDTLWQAGTDHAGIATQMVVERLLAAEGTSRKELGREKFLERVWHWKEESGGTITRQLRRMGASIDWSRERFTMDEGLSNAVKEVFVQLFDQQLIYRGKRLVNWDPKLHTAISDLEVENVDEQGSLWHFRYPLADGVKTTDGLDYLVVATTRPETMLGDTAVAVHPQDQRYQHLIGKEIVLPLVARRIPIVADDYVEREFGTGCVKITPAHDFNDYEVGKRHQLPMINILTTAATIRSHGEVVNSDGTANESLDAPLPEAYHSMDRFAARQKIIADFKTLGLLEKIEPHGLKVPRGDRSGTVIEPLLTDQWYVSVAPLAKPAIDAVKNGEIEFIPKQWENTYFAWMEDIQDWCISRQLWWGHRIPAWYDEEGRVFVARDEAEVREKYHLDEAVELHQDEDVLDTWFSSALWTFSTLGWPEETAALKRYHPTAVLVTGFDIIFFWVARMIMMTLKFRGEVPFKKVYVHGLVRDAEGQKMSKSKGNVLDPLNIIDGISLENLVEQRTHGMMQPQLAEKIKQQTLKHFPEGIKAHGTDALRFTFMSLASTGRDIKFDLSRLEGYRNFCNKLWNAARYVLMNTPDKDSGGKHESIEFSVADRWIQSEFSATVTTYREHIEQFRFDLAANTLYEFTWHQYCDWYLELAKPSLADSSANPSQLRGTRQTLITILEQMLRLLHPMMPFITEEIWQRVAPLAGVQGKTIMLAKLPTAGNIDQTATDDIKWLKQVILAVRTIRAKMNIAPGKPLQVLLRNTDDNDRQRLAQHRGYLSALARLSSVRILDEAEEAPASATGLAGGMEVLIPMAGLIDKDAELARLEKEITRLEHDILRLEGKLSNEHFIARAPAAIVAKEREKLTVAQDARQKYCQQKLEITAI